jgi:hypothetical protein
LLRRGVELVVVLDVDRSVGLDPQVEDVVAGERVGALAQVGVLEVAG